MKYKIKIIRINCDFRDKRESNGSTEIDQIDRWNSLFICLAIREHETGQGNDDWNEGER